QFLVEEPRYGPAHHFQFRHLDAELYLGEMCVTYLSFSDFETQIRAKSKKVFTRADAFGSTGLSQVPRMAGVNQTAFDLAYRLRGGHGNKRTREFDCEELLKLQQEKPQASMELKYQLLNYTIDNWLCHTECFTKDNTRLWQQFRHLA